MNKEKLLKENEILKSKLKEIYELLEDKKVLDEDYVKDAFKKIGRCLGMISGIQEYDKIDLGIETKG